MTLSGLLSVFVLSFAAFTMSVLSSWIVTSSSGILGEGLVLGAISSLFLALVLTKRRAMFGKIILSGSLAGFIGLPVAVWIADRWGLLTGGIFLGLCFGLAHWSLLRDQISPSWILVSIIIWGQGFGVQRSAGDLYDLVPGAIIFALIILLISVQPIKIVRGWATQPKRNPINRRVDSARVAPGNNAWKKRKAHPIKTVAAKPKLSSRRIRLN